MFRWPCTINARATEWRCARGQVHCARNAGKAGIIFLVLVIALAAGRYLAGISRSIAQHGGQQTRRRLRGAAGAPAFDAGRDAAFSKATGDVLLHAEKLSEVDVEQRRSGGPREFPFSMSFVKIKHVIGSLAAEGLSNAPRQANNLFIVTKVVE